MDLAECDLICNYIFFTKERVNVANKNLLLVFVVKLEFVTIESRYNH